MMQFRWSAAIALWTILSGPIMTGRGPFLVPVGDSSAPATVKQGNDRCAVRTPAILVSRK